MKLSEGHHTLKGGYEGGAKQCIHAVFEFGRVQPSTF